VLVAGEEGGATGEDVFVGFGIALVHIPDAGSFCSSEPAVKLLCHGRRPKRPAKGSQLSVYSRDPELLGVGFLIAANRLADMAVPSSRTS